MSGIGGTTMPSWKGTLEDNDIWAVSYYVKSLIDLKDTKERKVLIDRIEKSL
jgi:mono/diheme cytochrome c family protein